MLCRDTLWKTAVFGFHPLRLLAAAAAVALLPAPAEADIIGFGDFSGFTINQTDTGSAPTISNGSILLTNQNAFENRSIFCNARQGISQFTASFTYTLSGYANDVAGACFVLQDSTAAATACGTYNLAAGGISPSAEISLEIRNGNPGWSGFYTNGNIGGGSPSTSPVNLYSGDPINVTLTYNGSILHENLLDTVTAASYDASYVTNLPSILGRSDAFVGITANSGDVNCRAAQNFSNFHFTSSVPEPSTLVMTFSAAVGALLWWKRRKA